ncbi:hypothetical protein J5N97_008934 [Dioscorea zingiberensis]|uniref:Uncharacterized protein n=1 Tax=Dioscorea zingiberensis TaxID=325984 RepID=A0A9D5CX29_9LILI|nr:hypothetical protein J5N97_008934 [Dioscorea zingiberensis]
MGKERALCIAWKGDQDLLCCSAGAAQRPFHYPKQIPGRLAAIVTSTHYPVKRFSRFKVCAVVEEDDGPKWWEKMLGQI